MEQLRLYLVPVIISNLAAILILLASWKLPRLGRFLFVMLFGWASWMNSRTAINQPEAYLEYAEMAIPLYSHIITGWFSQHIAPTILIIAMCQLMIAVGMLLNRTWVKLACIGAITFLLAIAPLGVGSGFPFSIFTSMSAFLIYRKSPHDYLWKKSGLNLSQEKRYQSLL